MNRETPKASPNFAMISLWQFFLSLMVILVHVKRIFDNEAVHFIQKSIFGRMAVPFFIISSAFWLRKKMQEEGIRLGSTYRKLIKAHLIWSLVYLPYAIFYFTRMNLPLIYLPLGLLLALLYTGTCYQLWYLPAVVTGLGIVSWGEKRLSFRWLFLFSLFLYLLGSIETYTSYLTDTPILTAYQAYQTIFFTSRNGLFYVPIFICLGYVAYDYRQHPFLSQKPLIKLCIALAFWLSECLIVFSNPGLDKNFFIGLLPVSLLLFNWTSRTPLLKGKSWRHLKDMSAYNYFLHPIFVELGFVLAKWLTLTNQAKGITVAIFALITTCLTSYLITIYRKGAVR